WMFFLTETLWQPYSTCACCLAELHATTHAVQSRDRSLGGCCTICTNTNYYNIALSASLYYFSLHHMYAV
ncbi:hypothetical protein ACJX0J_037149, partial [Zea mays]